MSEFFRVLDRLKPPRYELDTPGADTPDAQLDRTDQGVLTKDREQARAFVVDNEETERTYVTIPVETAALAAEQFLTRLRGRLVGAEQANSNGQLWTSADLAFGLPSVAGGPLNWLHQERTIIGALTDATLVPAQAGRQVAGTFASTLSRGDPAYIKASSVVWSYLYPNESRVIRDAAATSQLYYSMECISGQVQCFGDQGCGAVMSYPDALHRTERACAHIRERAAARRFIDPIFQGAAVIVPPVKPGWSGAHLDLMRRAETAMSSPDVAQFADGDETLVAQILQFVKQGAR